MKFKDALLIAFAAVFLQVGFANLIQPRLSKKLGPYVYSLMLIAALMIIFYENPKV